jgi:hypothetical protein
VLKLLPELLIGPLLVAGATLASRRWGPHVGGLVSVFPAVVGPVLFITASERGAASAAQAANGTLLGLVALSGFVLTYAWVAPRAGWILSVLVAWAIAGLLAVLLGRLAAGEGFPAGLVAAAAALLAARRAMPRSGLEPPFPLAGAGSNLPLRMLATALLVVLLSTAAVLGGPLLGGLLAGLPVLASVLAISTHRREGAESVIALLRGMLAGMAGFVGFCTVVAWLIVPIGVAAAFTAAMAVAVGLQLLVLAWRPWLSRGFVAPGPAH